MIDRNSKDLVRSPAVITELDLPYVPVWPGQSRNLGSCPGQLSESPGFSWSQVAMLVC